MSVDVESLLSKYQKEPSQDQSMEGLLSFLREQGCSKIDSIKALRIFKDMSLEDAKRTVHLSETWADRRESDEAFQARFAEEFMRFLESDKQ